MSEHNICPECRCAFVQPFCCTTCGAQKLYDATLLSAESRANRLTAERDALRMALIPLVQAAISLGARLQDCELEKLPDEQGDGLEDEVYGLQTMAFEAKDVLAKYAVT